ncbi:hypothetical protein F183_A14010 [Bryobacterales bacterium F-183]|nr:hypothetical protein F183_A14010 [Bryobacterales bacterium F-183]
MADTLSYIVRIMSEARKQSILQAARDLCATHGAPALRMDAVATQAGVAKGTLYLYFKTKEDLLSALAQDEFASWSHDLAKQLRATRDPGSRTLARILTASLATAQLASQLADPGPLTAALTDALPELDAPHAAKLWRAICALHRGNLDPTELEEAIANQIRGAVRGQKNRKH